MEVGNLLEFRMLRGMGVFHGDDDSLGEEVLVDGHQVLLGHQHLEVWKNDYELLAFGLKMLL